MARRCEEGNEHLHIEPDLRTSWKRNVLLGVKSYFGRGVRSTVVSRKERNCTGCRFKGLKVSGCYTYRQD
jgi:hypothetical protein